MMIDRILRLTIIFLKNSFTFTTNKEEKKENNFKMKNTTKWAIALIVIFIGMLSFKVIDVLQIINQETIFLSILFLLLAFIIIFQTILICTNIFYNAKDLEYVLPLPIKPIEILIAKFNVMMITIYITELIFATLPLFIYGGVTNSSLSYYLYAFLLLLIFPILPCLLGVLIIMIFMSISRFFKNSNKFQILITTISIIVIFAIEIFIISGSTNQIESPTDEFILQKLLEANTISKTIGNYFITINSSIELLSNTKITVQLFELIKIIAITVAFFFIFIVVGKMFYLKGVFANLNKVRIQKKTKKITARGYKKHSITKTYIKKEFKNIIRNPVYFTQCVLPVFYTPILAIVIGIILFKSIASTLGLQSGIIGSLGVPINFGIICLLVGISQFLTFMSVTSVTAISRDGKVANFIKYIPISLYKQFIYKLIPSIIFNLIPTIITIIVAKIILTQLTVWNMLTTFLISLLITSIQACLCTILDFKRPKLHWDGEYAVVRQNLNIIFSIGILCSMLLVLLYLSNVLSSLELTIASLITIVILAIILILINLYIKIRGNKFFKKIV